MKNLLLTSTCILALSFVSCENDITVAQEEQNNQISLDSQQAATSGYTLIFEDNFSAGTDINTNWTRTNRADYNSAKCKYKPWKNSIQTFDGKSCLRLEATDHGSEYRSGHVKSRKSFHPGWNEEIHIKTSIKLIAKKGTTYKSFDQTTGAWPAFWTVQENGWPTRGEIDIMEAYSHGDYDTFASNMFYGTEVGKNLLERTAEREWHNFNSNSNNGWHTYEMFWRNNRGKRSIEIRIDGVTKATYDENTNSKLDLSKFTNHNLIINLNVGSDSGIFSKSVDILDKTWMFVDYVKVEKKKI